MPVASRSSSRALAFVVALMTLFALVIPAIAGPLAEKANAQTPGPGNLEVTPETAQNVTGQTHVLTATITGSNVTHNATVQVDFEIDCTTGCADAGSSYVVTQTGPGPTSPIDTPTEGNQTAGTTDDTRTTPELSCTVTINNNPATNSDPNDGTGSCTVSYQRYDAGDDEIAAWIDTDGSNANDESDAAEQRCANTGEGCANNTGEGNEGPVDDTDVVSKNWASAGVTGVIIDCDDQSGNSNNNADVSETETNQPGETEAYTCRATGPDGPDQGNERDVLSGIRIDAEQEGANDPDNSTFATAGSVDYNDQCITDANGVCNFNLVPNEGEVGQARVCFFYDADGDTTYDPNGGEADGGDCDTEGVFDSENTTTWGAGGGDDGTDKVQKNWGSTGALSIDATPEYDQNTQGTAHTVTAVVRDEFGAPKSGVPVDFAIEGGSRNDNAGDTLRLLCDNKVTDASGSVSCTYTDVGTGTDPITPNTYEADQIAVCIDADAGVGFEGCNESTDSDPLATDDEDEVEKYWFNTTPTATSLFVDMQPNGSDCGDGETAGAGAGTSFDETATNSVNSGHTFCVEVGTTNGADDPGEPVTVTLSGPGVFWQDTNGDNAFQTSEGRGTTTTVNTDEEGEVYLQIYSAQSGTTTVTATAEGVSDTGTKVWSNQPARTIDCEPETATNQLGETHTITCTARDGDGNPAVGVRLQAIEDGAGQFFNCAEGGTDDHYGTTRAVCDTATDNSGVATFQTTSTTVGTQTIEIAVECDAANGGQCDSDVTERGGAPGDTDDECDARAGEGYDGSNTQGVGSDPGAPAGVCIDSVTKTWSDTDPDPDPEPLTRGPCSGFAPGSRTVRPGGGFVIVGTQGNDLLDGSGGPDLICGLGGDDIIDGRGSGDIITGGGGNDNIGGGAGKDNITGGGGDDVISGNRGNDAIKGNGGNDSLKGNAGIDTLTGGAGNDTLQGGDGEDVLKGGGDNDTLRGGDQDDALDGGDGRDQCFGNQGDDSVRNCE